MSEALKRAGLLGTTAAICLCQILLSGRWLARRQYGRLEWLWRSLPVELLRNSVGYIT